MSAVGTDNIVFLVKPLQDKENNLKISHVFIETRHSSHFSTAFESTRGVEFPEIGLAFGGQLLSPDLDFKTLGALGPTVVSLSR